MYWFQLKFNNDGSVVLPTPILGNRNGKKLGILENVCNINTTDSLEDSPQVSFDVYKYNNGQVVPLWDDLITFKLVYCPEFDNWFEAIVEEKESDKGVLKNVSLTNLGDAELSQIRVYGLDINTEDSIIYDDNYKPTVLYDANDPAHSLLHRVMSFAPHYQIGYIDLPQSVCQLQRTFSFNDQTVLECLKTISEELSLFIVPITCDDGHGNIYRGIDVYDVLSTCSDCGYRGFFQHECPRCGGSNIFEGFGEDTTILVSADALGNDLSVATNTDAIANCYHLQAGDDLMTAAVRQCNPNGTGYIWSFTNEMLAEMSSDLSDAITRYNRRYGDYMSNHEYTDATAKTINYNELIQKYTTLDEDFDIPPLANPIVGYPNLIEGWYNALDFYYYLKTSLMPSESTDNISAQTEAENLYDELSGSHVAIGNTANLSLAAASTAVMNNARLIANTIYEVSIFKAALSGTTWTGQLQVKNFYNADDAAVTQQFSVTIDDNYETYVAGKVMKTLYNTTQGQSAVAAMFTQTYEQVRNALKLYSLDELNNINKAFNGAIEVISKFKGDQPDSDLYLLIYVPTKDKLDLVQAELARREHEVDNVQLVIDMIFNDYITPTQQALNFENFLGSRLWIELNSFRREANYSDGSYVSTAFRRKFNYSDSQFISDSLTNGEMVARAYEFLVQAEQKMAENNKYSYQINSSLKNLMVIPEFTALRDYFYCGAWIRIKTDNGQLFRLRLISWEMNFDNPESLTVSFSDVSDTSNVREAQQIIAQSVDLVKNQKRNTNKLNNKFTAITDDMQCDYVIKDSFTGGSAYDNIEIIGDQMVTTFEVLDGLIQGKISQGEAMSIIQQELNKITLSVQNGEYIPVSRPYPSGVNPYEEEWYERTTEYGYRKIYPEGNENPQAEGWYEKVNNTYVLSTDTEVDPEKEYYERGYQYVYYRTSDTYAQPSKQYYTHEGGESSIQIFYDGIALTTSGRITLGGTVVFVSELEEGTTVINGSCIQTGVIKSNNYDYTEGELYSDTGTALYLDDGTIRTPGFYLEDGTLHIREHGYIGGAEILTKDDGDGTLLDHVNNAWKLRSAPVDAEGTRYYTYLTKNKNLYVVNSADAGHSSTTDVSDECSIGSKKYPWKKGYFKYLRVQEERMVNGVKKAFTYNVIPEGMEYTLERGDWYQDSGFWCLDTRIEGLVPLESNMVADCYPTQFYNEFYGCRISMYVYDEAESGGNNNVIFYAESQPSRDLPIVIVAEDYVTPQPEGATDFDAVYDPETNSLACTWSSPSDASIFLQWEKDTVIIEKASYSEITNIVGDEDPHALYWFEEIDGEYEPTEDEEVISGKTYYEEVWTQVYSEDSTIKDAHETDPLIIDDGGA